MMKKPVTALLEAGDSLLNGPSSATWAAFESAMSEFLLAPDYDAPNVELLDVLDLVATLPVARFEALKEWLNEKPICPECCHRIGNPGDHSPGCVEASSGGEIGAKEKLDAVEEMHALETRLAEVRAKIRGYDGGDRPSSPPMRLLDEELDVERQLGALKRALAADEKPATIVLPAGSPETHTSACVKACACKAAEAIGKPDCQSCPWGMPMYDAQWCVAPGRTWCRHQYEYDRALGLAAKEDPKPTILPAGQPPPFLRVGMVLSSPTRAEIWTLRVLTQDFGQIGCGKRIAWSEKAMLLTWPLAKPFTVEES